MRGQVFHERLEKLSPKRHVVICPVFPVHQDNPLKALPSSPPFLRGIFRGACLARAVILSSSANRGGRAGRGPETHSPVR